MSPAILLVALLRAATIADDGADIFYLSDLPLKERPDEIHDWTFWSGEMRLGPNLVVPAEIQVTNKGNGTLRLVNLELRVIDDHIDSDFYEPRFLYTFLVDLNSDGYRDLVVCGRVWETDDDCDCAVRWRPVVEVFEFDAAAGALLPLLPQGLMRIDCLGY